MQSIFITRVLFLYFSQYLIIIYLKIIDLLNNRLAIFNQKNPQFPRKRADNAMIQDRLVVTRGLLT